MAYISQTDKKELAPAIKKVLKKYGFRGTISINNYSDLTVTVRKGKMDLASILDNVKKYGHTQVNTFMHQIDNFYSGEFKQFILELVAAMKGDKWYDRSDIMTDYFDTAYYLSIDIGTYKKPYEMLGA